jgi:hypothetical protein
MNYWTQFAIVFFAVALADVCWTFYFIKVEERKVIAASLWSSGIMLLGAISIESYVQDKTFIIASVLGAFVGTALSILYKKRKEFMK